MGGLEEAVAILRIAVSQSNSAASARFGLGDHGGVHAVEDGGVLEWFVLAFGDREHDEGWVFADIDEIVWTGAGCLDQDHGRKVSGIASQHSPRGMISRVPATVSSAALASVSLLAGQAGSRRRAGLEAG